MRVIVARLSEFGPGERRIVSAGGRSIGVFRVGDDFYALRNRCPHQGAELCRGAVMPGLHAATPGRVEIADGPPLLACPWHGWEYDMATGQSYAGGADPGVKAYQVTVEQPARVPGPYVAETFPVFVEEEYVVLRL